jgi:hypothetical protein
VEHLEENLGAAALKVGESKMQELTLAAKAK